jgi:hypothetical protein
MTWRDFGEGWKDYYGEFYDRKHLENSCGREEDLTRHVVDENGMRVF